MATTASIDSATPRQRSFWIPVVCGAAILTIGIGARSSFGIFQKPIAADLNVGREVWSFANALAVLLMGLLSPFVGNIADRFGTARTVACGGAIYAIGMLMIAFATESLMLTAGTSSAASEWVPRALDRFLEPLRDKHLRQIARSRWASLRPADRSASSRSFRSHRSCNRALEIGIRRCSSWLQFPF